MTDNVHVSEELLGFRRRQTQMSARTRSDFPHDSMQNNV